VDTSNRLEECINAEVSRRLRGEGPRPRLCRVAELSARRIPSQSKEHGDRILVRDLRSCTLDTPTASCAVYRRHPGFPEDAGIAWAGAHVISA